MGEELLIGNAPAVDETYYKTKYGLADNYAPRQVLELLDSVRIQYNFSYN